MSRFITTFLATEITSAPEIMQRHMGKFYSNALYNGLTWMVLILHVIRFSFELAVNALLKKMGFKEYLRTRLRKSLWYLGFYSCSYLYCAATLRKNGIMLPDKEKFYELDLTEPISGHLILGYVLLCAFFVSSSMWEGILCSFSAFTYLFLTGFVAFTYFLSYIELAVLLANNISMFHIMTEFTRCLSCIVKAHLNLPRLCVNLTFISSIATFFSSYLMVIPKGLMVPVGQGLIHNKNSVIMIGLNVTLWGWYICEVYSSPLFKLIVHHWLHQISAADIAVKCAGSTIDCALFQPRDDVAYNIKIIQKEMEEREARLRSLRQPKRSARMLLQTLKCVAALNRRMKNKRQAKEVETTTPVEDDFNYDDEKEISSTIFDSNAIEISGETLKQENELENYGKGQSDSVEEENKEINGDAVADGKQEAVSAESEI